MGAQTSNMYDLSSDLPSNISTQLSTYTDRFHFIHCDTGDGAQKLRGQKLRTALNIVHERLGDTVLPDLQLGVKSKHGYRAFFTTDLVLPNVEMVFRRQLLGDVCMNRHHIVDT